MKRLATFTLLAFAAIVPAAATAHNVTYKPTVATLFLTEGFGDETDVLGIFDFTKGVGPPDQLRKCERNRKGSIFRVGGGKIVTLTGDEHGNFRGTVLKSKAPAGSYYGKFPKRVLKKNRKHKHVCKGATTRRVAWAG